MAPFIVLLVAISLGPLLWPAGWARHYQKIAFLLGGIVLIYYLVGLRAAGRVGEVAHEYISFTALIGSLFVVSGGIHIEVKGEATPVRNVMFLLVGAVAANVLGTTGASMLLIRPWIRMNRSRVTYHHVVFFIFIISNVGGCLTPVGDPPLLLGYLRGVPFWWVTLNCWPMWATAVGLLLVAFFIVDCVNYRKTPRSVHSTAAAASEKWGMSGIGNLGFLAVILGAVFIKRPLFAREGIMLAAAVASWFITKKSIHEANHFTFHPITEVAVLFFGLFATMIPMLDLLATNGSRLGHPSPGLFYWGCGLLSSVLDNAPTYLAFFSAGLALAVPGMASMTEPVQEIVKQALAHPAFNQLLVATSASAVFFGANTYIGNAPNFMVKAIADHQKVPTPGFVGFLFRYSLPYMFPLLLLVWVLFFRG